MAADEPVDTAFDAGRCGGHCRAARAGRIASAHRAGAPRLEVLAPAQRLAGAPLLRADRGDRADRSRGHRARGVELGQSTRERLARNRLGGAPGRGRRGSHAHEGDRVPGRGSHRDRRQRRHARHAPPSRFPRRRRGDALRADAASAATLRRRRARPVAGAAPVRAGRGGGTCGFRPGDARVAGTPHQRRESRADGRGAAGFGTRHHRARAQRCALCTLARLPDRADAALSSEACRSSAGIFPARLGAGPGPHRGLLGGFGRASRLARADRLRRRRSETRHAGRRDRRVGE